MKKKRKVKVAVAAASNLKPVPDTSNWLVFIQEPRRAECMPSCFHMGLTQVQIPTVFTEEKPRHSLCIIWLRLAPAGLFTQSHHSDSASVTELQVIWQVMELKILHMLFCTKMPLW